MLGFVYEGLYRNQHEIIYLPRPQQQLFCYSTIAKNTQPLHSIEYIKYRQK